MHNCFGRWYNTDWDQKCGGLGADYSGTYETKAICTLEPDNYLTKWRRMGSTATYDGHDCDWSVTGAVTYFWE
ncbi:hypothetical protein [Streptomyces sp. Ru87]|uniref:hypothetical protein n=1 Tax=Streptomyces sp. Ru87 TaxID=2044307 RepID=UPI000BF91059|nr:hypothetical protein [Streptomyces sp. Ru87]PGH49543.1 hypothetical protein CRI70_16995 [Streptomyces sp. Ru87]